MSTTYDKTDNYGLNLYGDNDPADLRDGYNGSMRTIDDTLEKHLNRIEGVEARETHDEAVMKALLVDNTVDNATAAKTKWDKAGTDAAAAADKAHENTTILAALGADTADDASLNKAKWDKAGVDATQAINNAANATNQAGDNTALLTALGANTTINASASKTRWDKASADVDAVTKRVNIITGSADENIIVLGDSISSGIGLTDSSKSWANQLASYRNATVSNLSQSGVGYLNGTQTFLQQLKSYPGDKDSVTRILVAGGINDKVHVDDGNVTDSNLTRAVLSLLDYARDNFPHAKVQVIPTICGYTPPSLYHKGVLEARDRIIAACGMRHVEVLPYAWEWLNGNRDWSSGDDVHPNDVGQALLLRLICEAMDGATVRNSWDGTGKISGQDGHGIINNAGFHVDGNTVSCHIQGKAVNNVQAYDNIFQVPAAARNSSNMFVPNSLGKLLYINYDNDIRACKIGTTSAIPNDTEIYLSFTTYLG